ncbi:hypothetical protein OAP18_01545 [Gammaproteobacteria bacterium]|nr:hypothetical protein [Gammaproteobacteria bacterium]
MRALVLLIASITTFSVCAQEFTGMSEAEFQEQMAQMQAGLVAVGECMAALDEEEVQAMQARSMELGDEISRMCQAGDRDGAMSFAMSEAREFSETAIMEEVKACMSLVQGMNFPTLDFDNFDEEAATHICDEE